MIFTHYMICNQRHVARTRHIFGARFAEWRKTRSQALEYIWSQFIALCANMISWVPLSRPITVLASCHCCSPSHTHTHTPYPPSAAWLSIFQPREAYPIPSEPRSALPALSRFFRRASSCRASLCRASSLTFLPLNLKHKPNHCMSPGAKN